jgi:hypothetical protein
MNLGVKSCGLHDLGVNRMCKRTQLIIINYDYLLLLIYQRMGDIV